MGWELLALVVLCCVFGIGGLCVLALVGLGALVGKYGEDERAERHSERLQARGWADRAGRAHKRSEPLVEPESERGPDDTLSG